MNGEIEVQGDLAELGRLAYANRSELAPFAARLSHRRSRRRDSKLRQIRNVQRHYDLGNEFYALWLDCSMTYSCAYFQRPSDSLERAQRQKVEHILRKLDLRPGMTLLDIGSGWGELIIAAARRYGVRAHGVTLSREQLARTQERIDAEGLSSMVSVELCHYADLPAGARFDRVVSVGMYEHVGRGNHAAYMAAVDRVLRPGASRCCTRSPRRSSGRPAPSSTATSSPAGICLRFRGSSRCCPPATFSPSTSRACDATTRARWMNGRPASRTRSSARGRCTGSPSCECGVCICADARRRFATANSIWRRSSGPRA